MTSLYSTPSHVLVFIIPTQPNTCQYNCTVVVIQEYRLACLFHTYPTHELHAVENSSVPSPTYAKNHSAKKKKKTGTFHLVWLVFCNKRCSSRYEEGCFGGGDKNRLVLRAYTHYHPLNKTTKGDSRSYPLEAPCKLNGIVYTPN